MFSGRPFSRIRTKCRYRSFRCKSPSRANFVTCIRCIKTEQSNLYVVELIYLIVAILMISFLEHWQFKFDEVIPLSIRFRLGGNGTLARCSKARRKGGGGDGDTGEMELLAVVYWRKYGRWRGKHRLYCSRIASVLSDPNRREMIILQQSHEIR